MRPAPNARLRRAVLTAAPLALALALALALGACGGDDDDSRPTPTPTSTGTPTPTPTTRNVTACLTQPIGNSGFTPASLVIPDTLKLDFDRPSGFPNGRFLTDPVIDVTLAVLLLDLSLYSPGQLAALPLNPPNDSTLASAFPFLGVANGGARTPPTATTFNFPTNPVSDYRRVDRMGQPAVATALIPSSLKERYNDADPADDATNEFVTPITNQLTALHNALADDLAGANLVPCSTPG